MAVFQFGGGWSDEAVNYSPNDPASALIFNGNALFFGNQPLSTSYRISQSGAVGGFETGYNWQAGSNWLLGVETDFSFSGMNGRASNTSIFASFALAPPVIQHSIAEQSTDWYGTVRGRAGPALGCKDRISIYRLGDRDSTGDGPCGSTSSPCACILQCGLSRPLQRRSAWLELSLLV